MSDYSLTSKANFVESDSDALKNMIFSVGILYTMLENIVKTINDDNELALNLWNVGLGLQKACEIYVAGPEIAKEAGYESEA